MIRYYLFIFILSLNGHCQSTPESEKKSISFPGADGFGKYTTGGRGGKVYFVSNLNDDGHGSLRDAINKNESRIILFTISGNIDLKSPLIIKYGNVTIAGQSAPGDGICIRNYPFVVNTDNVVIRFLRFRLGDVSRLEADALGGIKGNENIIIDHCSICWATDECSSFYHNKNFTLQWCIISESLNQSVHSKGEHGYGAIWGGENASFHHNLLASHKSRMPRFSGSATTPNSKEELVDFRNNVIYNWVDNNVYGGERGRYNMVGNFYKPGPATKSKKIWMVNPWQPYGKFFIGGNFMHGNEAMSNDNILGIQADHKDSVQVDQPFLFEMTTNHTAQEAFDLVIKNVGASIKRDVVDSRIVEEVKNGNSIFGKNKNGIIDSQREVGGWPELKSMNVLKDEDQDGIPDDWERQHGLNPIDSSDGNKQTLLAGYDNIEVYVNELVLSIIK
ncbi:MAG: pectate lyase [Chryseolinea sp.]